MSLEQRFSASAERLVSHFAYTSTLVLKRVTTGALDDNRAVTPTIASATLRCSTPTPYGVALRDGTRVQNGDLRVHLWADDAALTFDPSPEMVVELDGDSYRVIEATKLLGAWELHLRGGGA